MVVGMVPSTAATVNLIFVGDGKGIVETPLDPSGRHLQFVEAIPNSHSHVRPHPYHHIHQDHHSVALAEWSVFICLICEVVS